MVFMCQRDSFLKEFSSTVKYCTKSKLQLLQNGKKVECEGYDVVLEDTILFPEGGGQPCDLGWLNDKEVLQVTRRADEAVHFLTEPFEEGSLVQQKINWNRRFDHMQQHSGQHLLSSILENQYKLMTTAWWLGEEESHVELDCTSISREIIDEVEEKCNKAIRDGVPVNVKVCEKNDPSLSEAHTRGLPDDHTGLVRVISIDGIDENLCCGTHVTNLRQLQVIKLLRAEPGKKNKMNLRFLVGSRVVSGFQRCLDREQTLTKLLNNDPARHADLVEKLQKSTKTMNKSILTMLKDIAAMEANIIKKLNPLPKYACFHRKEGDQNYIKALSRALDDMNIFYFIAVGDGKQGGNIIVKGDEEDVGKLTPQLCEILNGKSGGSGGRIQAKVSDLTPIPKCNKLIKDYFDSLSSAQ